MRIGSPIFPQRYLNRTSRALQTSLERLTSGKRINSARDDAAGLSMSIGLDAQVRGTTQAIRNANDGMSMLNVAEGAMNEMTNLLQSMRELAVQAANGTLSSTERSGINDQVSGLIAEFDRIASETDFNGIKLLDGTFGTRALQVGNEKASQIDLDCSDLRKESIFQKTVGTGTFQVAAAYTIANGSYDVELADFNGDGTQDVVTSSGDDSLKILLGNGDGTFKPTVTYAGDVGSAIAIGDVNGDGTTDVAVVGGTTAQVLFNNGDGTFKPGIKYTIGAGSSSVLLRDVNGDGSLDILSGGSDGNLTVLIGNGDGTFKAKTTYAAMATHSIDAGDLNGDGFLDVVTASQISDPNSIRILLGNGDGTFRQGAGLTVVDPMVVKIADLNQDGKMDIIADGDELSSLTVFTGDGAGSFSQTYAYFVNASDLAVADVNGDGIPDVIGSAYFDETTNVYIGNGDGTLKPPAFYTGFSDAKAVVAGDLNGDGVIDLVGSSGAGNLLGVLFGSGHSVTAVSDMDLTGQEKAERAIDIIDHALERVTGERSTIGVNQNRLETIVDGLFISRENLSKAYSEIMDADIAQETAELVRQQILQQAGISVLAQANMMQARVLELLRW